MLSRPLPLAQLLESGVRLSWQEAVALTQAAAALGSRGPAEDRAATLFDCALDERGHFAAAGSRGPSVSCSELALLLVRLLPPETRVGAARTPAALHAVIARALDLSDDAPFTSVEELSRALAAFEQGPRPGLLREAYGRCLHQLNALAPAARAGAQRISSATDKGETERRRSGAGVDRLRQLLRELDEHEYLVRARGAATGGGDDRRAPGSATRRGTGAALLALAAAIVVITVVGAGEQRTRRHALPAPATYQSGGGATSADTRRPAATETRITPEAGVAVRRDPRVDGITLGRPIATASRPPANVQGNRASSVSMSAHPRVVADRSKDATPGRPPTSTRTTRDRRWAPIRLFAAIRRHLSNALRGAHTDLRQSLHSGPVPLTCVVR